MCQHIVLYKINMLHFYSTALADHDSHTVFAYSIRILLYKPFLRLYSQLNLKISRGWRQFRGFLLPSETPWQSSPVGSRDTLELSKCHDYITSTSCNTAVSQGPDTTT